MAWTTPRTWSAGELVTASLMNTHVRDNLNALRDYMLGAQDLGSDWKISSGRLLRFSDSDVAHGMTSLDATDTWGAIKQLSATAGGLDVEGYTDNDSTALRLLGIMGNSTVTNAAVSVFGGKKNGTTLQALASGDILMDVTNAGTVVSRHYGSAGVAIVAGLNVGYAATAPAGNYITVGDVQFRMYLTTSTIPAILFDAAESPGAGLYYERLIDRFSMTCGGTTGWFVAATAAGCGPSAGLDLDVITTGAGTGVPQGCIKFHERTAPGAPDANKAVVYAVDNGAGKTQLMCLFSSGAAQQLAIQP